MLPQPGSHLLISREEHYFCTRPTVVQRLRASWYKIKVRTPHHKTAYRLLIAFWCGLLDFGLLVRVHPTGPKGPPCTTGTDHQQAASPTRPMVTTSGCLQQCKKHYFFSEESSTPVHKIDLSRKHPNKHRCPEAKRIGACAPRIQPRSLLPPSTLHASPPR